MPNLLVIEVSPRGDFSTSELTAHFIERWKAAHPGASIVIRDLMNTKPPFVDFAWIGGAFTPRDQHSPESIAAMKISDELVAELQAADQIVIGTPMFNFSIPAVLKAYIDQIVRVGVTVSPDNVGLLTGKKATIVWQRAATSARVRRSKNTIKPAAICARFWPGSELPTSKSFLPTARVRAARGKRPSNSLATPSNSPRPLEPPSHPLDTNHKSTNCLSRRIRSYSHDICNHRNR